MVKMDSLNAISLDVEVKNHVSTTLSKGLLYPVILKFTAELPGKVL
jgi:hypothetical protein